MSQKTPLCKVCKEETGVIDVDVCQECAEKTGIKPTPIEQAKGAEWVEFIRKTTTEEGLLFATQKDSGAKKTTTRVWEINTKALTASNIDPLVFLRMIRELPDN